MWILRNHKPVSTYTWCSDMPVWTIAKRSNIKPITRFICNDNIWYTTSFYGFLVILYIFVLQIHTFSKFYFSVGWIPWNVSSYFVKKKIINLWIGGCDIANHRRTIKNVDIKFISILSVPYNEYSRNASCVPNLKAK